MELIRGVTNTQSGEYDTNHESKATNTTIYIAIEPSLGCHATTARVTPVVGHWL